MTDSRTTELRRLLDERGVEHYDHENGEPLRVLEKAEGHATSWRIDGASYCAVPDGKGTFDVWIDHCTPEQAIAATLWNGVERTRTEYDALTAEQVRGVLLCHLPHREYYSVEQTDAWQAIADELNAELVSGTCKPIGEWVGISQTQKVRHVSCSECGYEFGMEEKRTIPFEILMQVELPNFCPNCGARVEVAR